MLTVEQFQSEFDENGCYRAGDGQLDVVFATRGGNRTPGQLFFTAGLCVKARVNPRMQWSLRDNKPLTSLHFLIEFANDTKWVVVINDGRIRCTPFAEERPSKQEFLEHLRRAQNFFLHQRSDIIAPEARAHIWLNPKSVAQFRADDFPELGSTVQRQLEGQIQEFLEAAKQEHPNAIFSLEQYLKGRRIFQEILEILRSYLKRPIEANDIESVMTSIELPDWVVNWDFMPERDADGTDCLILTLYVDERTDYRERLGEALLDLATKIHEALDAAGITRWPYVRLRGVAEFVISA